MKLISGILLLIIFTQLSYGQPFYFKYSGEGTYYPYLSEVTITGLGKMRYTRTYIHTGEVYENRIGTIGKSDMNFFISELIIGCQFFKLPESPDEMIKVKDLSRDYFTVIYREKKYKVGGYGATYFKPNDCIYSLYNMIIQKVTGEEILIHSDDH
jgi:hypothetical protein